MDCRRARMRVNCLFGARMGAVGPYGMNAASENADELNVMWNGIGWVMLNTRDAGMYSCHRARARSRQGSVCYNCGVRTHLTEDVLPARYARLHRRL